MIRPRNFFPPHSTRKILLGAALLLGWGLAAAPATAAARLESLGKCLSTAGDASADGSAVVLSSCAGRPGQSWQLPPRGFSGPITGPGGKCLDVSGGNPADRTPIIVFSCHGLANQVWRHEADGRIVGLADKCLDLLGSGTADGTPLVLFPCTPTPNQLWRAEEVNRFAAEPLLEGAFFEGLAASPAAPTTLYAAAGAAGVLRSENAGRDWAAANTGLPLGGHPEVFVAPLDARLVYVLDQGRLFRSRDGGRHFQSAPAAPTGLRSLTFDPFRPLHLAATDGSYIYTSSDGGDYFAARLFPYQQSPGTLQQLVYDPLVPNRMWAAAAATCAFCTGPDQGVYRSVDNGDGWSKHFDLPTSRIALDPHADGHVYALIDKQLYRTTNAGATWQLLGNFPAALTDVWADSAFPGRVVAGHQAGFARSVDGGASFLPVDAGLRPGEYPRRLLYSGARLFAAIASTDGHSGRGLVASSDFGATFPRPNVVGYPAAAIAEVEKLAGPRPAIWAATPDGIWVSTDGGVRYSRSLPVTGPAEAAAIEADPYDATGRTLYAAGHRRAGANAPFLWKTVDGGATWQGVAGSDLEVRTGGFAATQFAGKKVFVTTLQGFFGGTNYKGILSSEADGGWKPLQLGVRLSLLAAGPADGLLYAAGDQLLRSLDGGQHWQTLQTFSATAMTTFGEELVLAGPGELHRSVDRGVTFETFPLPPEIGQPTALAANTAAIFLGDRNGGVYVSSDRGRTFLALDLGLSAQAITSLEPDPADGAVIYAGTAGGGLHRVRMAPATAPLRLADGRFTATITWKDFLGQRGGGRAAAWTADTGYFWFFEPENVEVMVKVLDGRLINGAYWVFVGSLSNVEFALTVRDEWTGAVWTYDNPLGSFASFGDIGAFPEPGIAAALQPDHGPASGQLGIAAGEENDAGTVSLAAPPALGGDQEIVLGDRFVLSVAWDDGFGQTGQGLGRRMTADTAAFTFFSETNTELVIKVLDGTAINGHHWVFYGALSNVGYVITIRDLETGRQVLYQNPVGAFASVGDIEAF